MPTHADLPLVRPWTLPDTEGMRWDIVIGGLGQHAHQRNGVRRLHDTLLRFQSPRRHVRFRPWNANWRALAEEIAWMNGGPPIIKTYSFSFGGGWGFPRFSRALQNHSLWVEAAVFADAVYRSPFLPTWLPLNPLSVSNWIRPVITIPDNVRNVWAFRQAKARPCGHEIVPECHKSTAIHCQVEIEGVTHFGMDDLQDFHRLCETVAEKDR